VKPTYSIPIVGVSSYIAIAHRARFPAYLGSGAFWAAGFLAYSWSHFGVPLPHYYQMGSQLTATLLGRGLLVNLISPSRGLLVFVPIIVFIVYLLVRYARDVPLRGLVVLSAGIVVAHILTVSGFPVWWAGFSYGPRFSTAVVPWFALLAITAVKARELAAVRPGATRLRGRMPELIVGGILLAVSTTMNGVGANSRKTARWNAVPVSVDEQPERVLDWRHPQFLPR
jgi:hypothetical protein